jgi:hypothetical protein
MKLFGLALFALSLIAWAQETKPPSQEGAPPVTKSEQAAEKTSPNPKALVYVLRDREMNGAMVKRSVYCDEVELAKIQNGRYFLAKVDPGHHVFRSTEKESGVEMDLKSGQKYFLRVEIVYGGGGRMSVVAPEQGPYEVKKLKPIDANKIVNTQMVVPPDQSIP